MHRLFLRGGPLLDWFAAVRPQTDWRALAPQAVRKGVQSCAWLQARSAISWQPWAQYAARHSEALCGWMQAHGVVWTAVERKAALAAGHFDAYRLMTETADADEEQENAVRAALHGNYDACMFLCRERGAEVPNERAWALIDTVMQEGHAGMCELLSETGAEPREHVATTAFQAAFARRDWAMCLVAARYAARVPPE